LVTASACGIHAQRRFDPQVDPHTGGVTLSQL